MNLAIKICTSAVLIAAASAFAENVKTLELTPTEGMTRANLSYIIPEGVKEPGGFLLLASGYNSDGTFLIKKTEWIEFAKKHELILVGLSFASNTDDLTNGKGYYYASKGSGQVFLDGLDKIQGGELPIYVWILGRGAFYSALCRMEARAHRLPLRVRRRLVGLSPPPKKGLSRNNSLRRKRYPPQSVLRLLHLGTETRQKMDMDKTRRHRALALG